MKIATVGTGSIVDIFLDALGHIQQAGCCAMYSRRRQTAGPLAEKYSIETVYTELDEMLSDPKVDFVYIASPNSLHFEHARRAMDMGKNVICEKPFTSTLREADRLISLAKEKGLMLFEAITTIHMPNYGLIKEHLGALGRIKLVQCNYSKYSSRYKQLLDGEMTNIFNPEFSGGALVDINVYNLHFVMNLFGAPGNIRYFANKHQNGIDTSGVLLLEYPGFIAECAGCKDTPGMNFVFIQGENGYLHVENGPYDCNRLIFHLQGQELVLNAQTQSNNLYYETKNFCDIYREKNYARCYELLEHSRSVVDMLERARRDAGIIFAADSP